MDSSYFSATLMKPYVTLKGDENSAESLNGFRKFLNVTLAAQSSNIKENSSAFSLLFHVWFTILIMQFLNETNPASKTYQLICHRFGNKRRFCTANFSENENEER